MSGEGEASEEAPVGASDEVADRDDQGGQGDGSEAAAPGRGSEGQSISDSSGPSGSRGGGGNLDPQVDLAGTEADDVTGGDDDDEVAPVVDAVGDS